jgi:hypothetical protein
MTKVSKTSILQLKALKMGLDISWTACPENREDSNQDLMKTKKP